MQDLDLGEFDEFDWNLPEKLERQGSIGSSDSNGVRFSPQDEFQGFFRPSCSRVDSPIELEFDHGKAVLGKWAGSLHSSALDTHTDANSCLVCCIIDN